MKIIKIIGALFVFFLIIGFLLFPFIYRTMSANQAYSFFASKLEKETGSLTQDVINDGKLLLSKFSDKDRIPRLYEPVQPEVVMTHWYTYHKLNAQGKKADQIRKSLNNFIMITPDS